MASLSRTYYFPPLPTYGIRVHLTDMLTSFSYYVIHLYTVFLPRVEHEEYHLFLHLHQLYEFDPRSLTKGYSRQILSY